MPITDKTRKNLWAKSGNRCAICKKELFSNVEKQKDTNIGEECHIISSKFNGPRYKSGITDYDVYDNLILLCRNHHKIIDDLTDTYTEEVLRYFKLNHENWVSASLNSSLETENKNKPRF
jgi:predicted restriction endonuclease